MQLEKIIVRGARTHNLKNITVELPRNKINVITGLSGSGKSSLAYDTIYAEGQRRYVESLSAYARQFLSLMEKPDVDSIEGLSPAISIHQKGTRFSPRSTVGTVTEIYDYLRLLYARVGEPRCPEHKVALNAKPIAEIVDLILSLPEGTRIALAAPVVRDRKGEHENLIAQLKKQGFVRLHIDGQLYEIEQTPELNQHLKHTINVIVDRLVVSLRVRQRLAESVETAVQLSNGLVLCFEVDAEGKLNSSSTLYSNKFGCPFCGYILDELEPRIFSFNNPQGACPRCNGLGYISMFDKDKIVVDSSLCIASGALATWNSQHGYYYSMLKSISKHYKFDLDTPFKKLPKSYQDIILYGSGNEKISMTYESTNGRIYRNYRVFEGVIPNFRRRLKESTSNAVKEELSKFLAKTKCTECEGSRLKIGARNVFVSNLPIYQITKLNINEIIELFDQLWFDTRHAPIAERIVRDIKSRLKFLADVGLTYVNLERTTNTLSGGELQRIRLASQVGSGLVGVTYVLDEPSIGLHDRDNEKLLNTLNHLRDIGNTLIIVEHDEKTIRNSDFVVDMGPRAGADGGQIVFADRPEKVENCIESLTGAYLSGHLQIPTPVSRVPFNPSRTIRLEGARGNNLKNINIDIPVGLFTCVTGVSGSGKSTLINDTVYRTFSMKLHRSKRSPAPHDQILSLEHIDKVIRINQQPIGRTPRSNPATYTKVFGDIRNLFSRTLEARTRGYKPGRFSFNVTGGRCEACNGDGLIRVEMHFLPDMFVRCNTCGGSRYNRETLEILYKGLNISQVLDLSVGEGLQFFNAVPPIYRKLKTLHDVGLDYIRLGQSAVTLSGGEAQRVKLSLELSKRDTGNTLYLLDEPTTGLHFHDIKQLLSVIQKLRDRGNTVIIIEHNLEVIKCADWIIDLGPEGGDDGGYVIATGTPEQICQVSESHTGRSLSQFFSSKIPQIRRVSGENY